MSSVALETNVVELKQDTLSLESIIEKGVVVSIETPTSDVLDLIFENTELRVVSVVNEGIPVGLVSRQSMVEIFSRPFRRELFGKQAIQHFMDTDPIIVDVNSDIDEIASTLVSVGIKQMLDGFIIVDDKGCFIGTGNAQDLLGEVTKRRQAHLHRLAHYDSLTDLPNRNLFHDRLTASLQQAHMTGKRVAVAFIDVDHFKRINDTLGHHTGDQLLKKVSRRVEEATRGCDTIARMGGDEFTMIITDLNHIEDASQVIDKIRQQLRQPFMLEDCETNITVSMGVSLYPDDGLDADVLMRRADSALYDAKNAGRDTYRFFDKAHDMFDESRLFLEHDLRTAISQSVIEPWFQSIVDARTGEIIGAEALARWRHPERGMIPPSQFVALAEDIGLIKQLSKLIATRSLSTLTDNRMQDFKLSLNISVRELNSRSFINAFLGLIEECGYPADLIQLEITERMFIEPTRELLNKLDRIRETGARIAIDDFGVGSTSLRLLHMLPVDVLKIDRSFISGERDARSDALVRAIIDMGHALDLKIVAEGVETDEQRCRLISMGCDHLQGYLFGKPAPADGFIAALQDAIPDP